MQQPDEMTPDQLAELDESTKNAQQQTTDQVPEAVDQPVSGQAEGEEQLHVAETDDDNPSDAAFLDAVDSPVSQNTASTSNTRSSTEGNPLDGAQPKQTVAEKASPRAARDSRPRAPQTRRDCPLTETGARTTRSQSLSNRGGGTRQTSLHRACGEAKDTSQK